MAWSRPLFQHHRGAFAAKEHGAGAAAICSLQAAADAGLTVLRENVQNAENNRTRFIIISRSLYISSEAQK
ncbi:MAG: prephenate dehydratase domain-containing protein [Hydrogeniiclostridium mannosilyticum]